MSIGFTEIILIVIFILLVFGAKRIPELARSLGRASGEFKKAKDEFRNELNAAEKESDDSEKKTDKTEHKDD